MTDEMIGIIFLIALAVGTGMVLLDSLGFVDMSRHLGYALIIAAIIAVCLIKGWSTI